MELGQSYHIYNHAIGSENIFREQENYRYFLQQYKKYLGGYLDTYAYCLMPNHFHFLIRVREDLAGFQNLQEVGSLIETFPKFETLEKLVSKQFSNFFSSYTQSYNKVYTRRGSLFLKNFKRIPILTESQWQETFLYIHLNPVKHGFVKNHEQWKWSSWESYGNLDKPSTIDRSYFLNYFDGWRHVLEMMEAKKEWLMNADMEG